MTSLVKPHAEIGTITVVEKTAIDLEIVLPLRLVSEANAHTHWRTRQRRAKEQRGTVRMCLGPASEALRKCVPPVSIARWTPPIQVVMTRLAPRQLDSDNLVGACKHVRDGVADALGVNDRDARVLWSCHQRKPISSEKARCAQGYGVQIQIRILWPDTKEERKSGTE